MNQHSWVYGCYQYYLDNYIEPGNPEDGVWEAAHWPVPACRGGTKTILLLKEHHAVHGVLQSEEWQYPCVFGWEAEYLEDELLTLMKKWHGIKSSKCTKTRIANHSKEQISEWAKAAQVAFMAKTTPEQRSENARKAGAASAARSPEEKSKSAKKAIKAWDPEKWRRHHQNLVEAARNSRTTEQRSETTRQAQAKKSPEERSAAAYKAWETRRRKQKEKEDGKPYRLDG